MSNRRSGSQRARLIVAGTGAGAGVYLLVEFLRFVADLIERLRLMH